MTTQTQIRIDEDIKKQAVNIFKELGIDMSTAVNIFLHQVVLRKRLPFEIYIPNYNKETIDAIEEAKRLVNDNNIKSYSSLEELRKALKEK